MHHAAHEQSLHFNNMTHPDVSMDLESNKHNHKQQDNCTIEALQAKTMMTSQGTAAFANNLDKQSV